MVNRLAAAVSAAVLSAALAACGPSEPLRIDTIQLGRSLNPDNSVGNHTTSFKPLDTMYVSILTPDKGKGTLSVRWTYAGRVVSEPAKEVSYKGPAATEFHIQNSSGFPPGEYAVEVFLDGQPAGKRDYRVEK
jgi:ABC-type oligopeptide transport system substrate-binding subunit